MLRLMRRLVFSATGVLVLQFVGCIPLPTEQCGPSGYFEGILSGGGDLLELWTAVASDAVCGLIAGSI